MLHEHRLPGLQFPCFPTTEPTKPQCTLRSPHTTIFPLMSRGAGYRSPTLTICRNGQLAKNAKRRHGFCSEIIRFSNMLSAHQQVRRLNNLRLLLAPGFWNAPRHHRPPDPFPLYMGMLLFITDLRRFITDLRCPDNLFDQKTGGVSHQSTQEANQRFHSCSFR